MFLQTPKSILSGKQINTHANADPDAIDVAPSAKNETCVSDRPICTPPPGPDLRAP